jgi:dTDP-glucose 4,6-dehydratase
MYKYNHILITGGAGFIGSNFVHYVAKKYSDIKISVLDKLTYAGNLDNIQVLIDSDRVKFVQGDIADQQFLDQLFEANDFDCVVNFAAETHVDRSIIDPHVFIEANVIGTHNLLLTSKNHNVKRFHQISTDEVYGDLGETVDTYFTEDTPLDPTMPYAASKASADMIVMSYFNTYGMPVTISRCSNNYGPYQYPEKLVPYFFRLASQDKPLPVYGDGLNIRDWLYVEDHCTAIDLILHKAEDGSIYNIGGHNEKTNLEITKIILQFLNKDSNLITYVEDRKAHDRRYAIDPSKIKAELGWQPTVKFEDGIKLTFDWYENNKSWWDKLLANANRIK